MICMGEKKRSSKCSKPSCMMRANGRHGRWLHCFHDTAMWFGANSPFSSMAERLLSHLKV